MDLLQRILECKEEEVESIIDEAIKDANESAEKVEQLGFGYYGKMVGPFKGFIPFETRIKFDSHGIGAEYGMHSTDFFYEFAHFIRENNINTKNKLVTRLVEFVRDYFKIGGDLVSNIDREDLFMHIHDPRATSDDRLFELICENKISDLKGLGLAQCTEIGAVAQQILSLFLSEVYYCNGSVEYVNGKVDHCFNVAKTIKGYALLDYSIPVAMCDQNGKVIGMEPFIGMMTDEEFLNFVNNGTVKTFYDYYVTVTPERVFNQAKGKRSYIAGVPAAKKVAPPDEGNKHK